MKHSGVAIVGLGNLLCEGLQSLLRKSRFTVVADAMTLEEVLANFATVRPELVICAIADGEAASARIEQIRACRNEMEGVRVVLLVHRPSAATLRDAAASGVQAVLLSNITSDVLQRSLDLVMLGQQLFPGAPDEAQLRSAATLISFKSPAPATTAAREPSQPSGSKPLKSLSGAMPAFDTQYNPALSDRERQILRYLLDGAANKTIARQMDITEATVKVHLKGLLRKIRVNNRTQAAVWGLNNPVVFDDAYAEETARAPEFESIGQATN